MDGLIAFGISLIQSFQSLSPALDAVMGAISFLGTIEFYLLLIPLLYWVVDSQLGLRLLLVLVFSDVVGVYLKHIFHQPRPYWVGDVKGLAKEASYGVPSTHASGSFTVWGFLAVNLRKRWLWITAFLVVFLIGFSRMFLAVHFPHDVLLGWVIGLLSILVFVKSEQKVLSWLKAKSIKYQIWLIFVVSIAIALIGLLIDLLTSGSPDPQAWAAYAAEARSPEHFFTISGAFFGAGVGYIFMLKHAHFQTKGEWLQKLGRYLLGMAGLFIVYLGLDWLFGLIADDATAIGYLLRYIRYAAVTFWALFGAPWVFLKVKLAKEST